jgi:hypothetical protein
VINKKITLIIALALGMQNLSGMAQAAHADNTAVSVSAEQSPAINPLRLARVQESEIQKHKDALKSDLFYTNITRIGTRSLAAIALLYVLYSYINPWFYKVDRLPVIAGVIPADIGDRVQGLEKMINPDTFSAQWFKNYGKNMANGVVVSVAASGCASVAADVHKAVFHPDSFEWFVQNKTELFDLLPFQIDPRSLMNGLPADLQMHMIMLKNQDRIKKSTIEQLREYINALEGFESFSDENKAMSIHLIRSTTNSVVSSLEKILGFMAFKQESAISAAAQEIESHIRYISNSVNIFCDKLSQTLANNTLDGQKKKQEAISALSSLKGELHRICMRFVAIEREQNI